jgi:hypothetical protein
MITRSQWIIIGLIGLVMFADTMISLDGAWNHNATFYEANPIFAAFGTVEAFTIAVINLKAIAMVIIIWFTSALNKEPGTHWGNIAVTGGLFSCSSLIGVMMILNVII